MMALIKASLPLYARPDVGGECLECGARIDYGWFCSSCFNESDLKAVMLFAHWRADAKEMFVQDWLDIARYFSWSCAYCGGKMQAIDHVIPRSAGGATRVDNIVPCCKRCNSKKGGHLLDEVLDSLPNARDVKEAIARLPWWSSYSYRHERALRSH
jgi:hypothetical protein